MSDDERWKRWPTGVGYKWGGEAHGDEGAEELIVVGKKCRRFESRREKSSHGATDINRGGASTGGDGLAQILPSPRRQFVPSGLQESIERGRITPRSGVVIHHRQSEGGRILGVRRRIRLKRGLGNLSATTALVAVTVDG